MTKIKFLGTGSLEGIPSPLCKCSVCESARKKGKDKRLRSSIYIEFNDKTSLIIDCSPDFREQVENFKIPIENIFITHGHYDHFSGLGELSYLIPLYGVKPKIHGKKDVVDYCKEMYGYIPMNFSSINSSSFKIGNNLIELIPVIHAKNTSTSGIYFNNILIIPEIYNLDENIKKSLKDKQIELLIIDATYYKEQVYKDHFTIQMARDFTKEIGAKRTIVTNIWHNTKTHELLTKEFKKDLEIAFDGLTIEI